MHEDNESGEGGGGGGGGGDGPPVGNPVDQQLIVELEETEEDIVNTLQVSAQGDQWVLTSVTEFCWTTRCTVNSPYDQIVEPLISDTIPFWI